MSLHVCSYVVCSRVPKSYVEVCSSSLQHKTCRLYNYKEKQGPRKKYEQNNRASLKSRYEFIHYSCALIYLLISFFPPSPFSSFTSRSAFSRSYLFFFPVHIPTKRHIPIIILPISTFVSFFDTHIIHSLILLSNSHALSCIRTHTFSRIHLCSLSLWSFGYSFSRSLYSLDIAMRV